MNIKYLKQLRKIKFTQILLIIIAGLLFVNFIGKQSISAQLSLFNPKPTPTPSPIVSPAPTSTPTPIPTPTPKVIYIYVTPAPTPTGPSKKEVLDSCLKKADDEYKRAWDNICASVYNAGPNCNNLSVYQISMLDNQKEYAKNECYRQYNIGN